MRIKQLQSKLETTESQVIQKFFKKRGEKTHKTLISEKKPFYPIKESNELEEEDDISPVKLKSKLRAKSSSLVRRNKKADQRSGIRPNTSNFMYRPLRPKITNKPNSDLNDVEHSDIVYASSSFCRPSTTTFSSYQRRIEYK